MLHFKSYAFESNREENNCRDVVEVEGGSEWKLRKLTSDYPESCWKYASSSAVIQHYFQQEIALLNKNVLIENSESVLTTFYGIACKYLTPMEILILPKYLKNRVLKINDQLAQVDSLKLLIEEQVIPSAACVCLTDEGFRRARILHYNHDDKVEVRLIDIGKDIVTSVSCLYQLPIRFGRIPPLILICTLRGLHTTDLTTEKAIEFGNNIKTCRELIRVELYSITEPYLIDIFHPTVANYNLGAMFYRRTVYERSKPPKKPNEICESSDEYLDNEEEDEEEAPQLFIHSYPSICEKIRTSDSQLSVVNIENAGLIYVQSKYQSENKKKIEDWIEEKWETLQEVHSDFLDGKYPAVAVQVDGYHRAIVQTVFVNHAEVFLIDMGTYTKCKHSDMRLLSSSALLTQEPLIFLLALPQNDNYFPHPTETFFIRQALPIGSQVKFLKSNSKKFPNVGDFVLPDGNLLTAYIEQKFKEERIFPNCKDLIIYSSKPWHFSYKMDAYFVHRPTFPTCLTRTKLKLDTLCEFM